MQHQNGEDFYYRTFSVKGARSCTTDRSAPKKSEETPIQTAHRQRGDENYIERQKGEEGRRVLQPTVQRQTHEGSSRKGEEPSYRRFRVKTAKSFIADRSRQTGEKLYYQPFSVKRANGASFSADHSRQKEEKLYYRPFSVKRANSSTTDRSALGGQNSSTTDRSASKG